jgi:hypothetical protein
MLRVAIFDGSSCVTMWCAARLYGSPCVVLLHVVRFKGSSCVVFVLCCCVLTGSMARLHSQVVSHIVFYSCFMIHDDCLGRVLAALAGFARVHTVGKVRLGVRVAA